MSSPVVETVRSIPLIVEHGRNTPMEVEEISGFPFDRESDRDAHFRSQLDDIAKRHPEFAEHLGNLRTGVRRQSSLGSTDEPDFHRRFQRPFGSRFERFGFPFDGDDLDPEQYAQQFYQPHQEFQEQQPSGYSQQQYQQQQQQQPQQQPEYHHTERQPQATSSPDHSQERSNIQQSNTIDLGQKQEPVNERGQRSMSAPPPEKGQRFTSSINIPVNQPSQGEDMAQTQSQQQANAKTTERIIPIHVEDRDEPVLPKKAAPTYSQPHSTFSGTPQPETIFGRRPEEFTHFVNREPRQFDKWHSGFNHPEEFVRQQRFPQQQNVPPQHQHQQQATPKNQAHPKGEIPIPVKVEVPLNKQKTHQRTASPQPQPQQQQAPPPQQPQQQKPTPQQQKKPQTPLEQIQAIQKDVATLARQVEQFTGKPKDKQYLYLDEMLTRNLLKLDNVDTQGQDDIRSARKEAIRTIEKTIGVLEAKAAANVEPAKAEDKMEVEEKSDVAEQSMEAEVEAATNGAQNSDKSGESQQPMEVVPENPASAENAEKEEPKEESSVTPPAEAEPAPLENRAVLVENKPEQVENRAVLVEKPEQVENRAVLVENKPEQEENRAVLVENNPTAAEEQKMETCEGQESNLPVADAVKKFEGNADNAETKENETTKPEESKESSQEAKTEDKKGKKKGKKKVEKKEK